MLPITVLGSACPAPAEESGVGWAAAARLDTQAWSSPLASHWHVDSDPASLTGAGWGRATAVHPPRIRAGSGRDFSDLCRASALSCRFYGGLLGFIRVCWDLYSNWEVLQIRVGPERASRVARACKCGASSGSETIPGGGSSCVPCWTRAPMFYGGLFGFIALYLAPSPLPCLRWSYCGVESTTSRQSEIT